MQLPDIPQEAPIQKRILQRGRFIFVLPSEKYLKDTYYKHRQENKCQQKPEPHLVNILSAAKVHFLISVSFLECPIELYHCSRNKSSYDLDMSNYWKKDTFSSSPKSCTHNPQTPCRPSRLPLLSALRRKCGR